MQDLFMNHNAQSAKKYLQKIVFISVITLVMAFVAGTIHLGFVYLQNISESTNIKVRAFIQEQIAEAFTEFRLDKKLSINARFQKIQEEMNNDPYIENLCIRIWSHNIPTMYKSCEINSQWNRQITLPLNAGSTQVGTIEVKYTLVGAFTTICYAVAPSIILIIAHAIFVLFVIFRCAERILIVPFAAAVQASEQLAANNNSIRMLAHDVRRPFSMLAIILNELKQAGSAREVSELSERRLPPVQNTLNQITLQMNEFIQPSDFSQPIKPHPINQIIGSAVELIHFIFPKYPAPIVSHSINGPAVMCNPQHMQRVLENILANAFEATGPHGQIRISALESNDCVTIFICNNGPEIPEEDLPYVFAETYSKGKRHGNGLGLAIAKRYVEQANGIIACKNIPAGGVEFSIQLPKYQGSLYAKDSNFGSHVPRIAIQNLAKPLKILIVEDEIIYQDALIVSIDQLNKNGYAITPMLTQTPTEALSAFHEWLPDALICDQILGIHCMSGLELAKEIHQYAPRIPILILSNGVVHPDQLAFANQDYLQIAQKPFELQELKRFLQILYEPPFFSVARFPD